MLWTPYMTGTNIRLCAAFVATPNNEENCYHHELEHAAAAAKNVPHPDAVVAIVVDKMHPGAVAAIVVDQMLHGAVAAIVADKMLPGAVAAIVVHKACLMVAPQFDEKSASQMRMVQSMNHFVAYKIGRQDLAIHFDLYQAGAVHAVISGSATYVVEAAALSVVDSLDRPSEKG
jgi:hypothetical protein